MTKKDNILVFQDKNHLMMQFPSKVDHINRVEEETRNFLVSNGLSAEIFSVCLAMREGLLNAVKHGNQLDAGKTVKYTLKFFDDILTMEIEDQGDGFDWQSIKHVHPSEKSEHGRGIFIMKRYFSEFKYHGKGNKLTLTKFSPANQVRGDKRRTQLEDLAQAILQSPERIRDISEDDLFLLIEDLYIRNNRLALQNAELRRAQAWLSGRVQGEKNKTDSGDGYHVLFEHNPAGTITVDDQGRITEYSLAKRPAGGRLPEIGSVMYRDYAAGHKIDMHAELMACIKSGEPGEFPELPYEDKVYYIRISPFSGGAVITSLDITSLKKAKKKFVRLVAAIEETEEEILVFDDQGSVEYANAAFLNSSGLTRDKIIHAACDSEQMEMIGETFTDRMRQVMADGESWRGLMSRKRAGIREETAVTIAAVKDENGAVEGYVVISKPVDESAPEKPKARRGRK